MDKKRTISTVMKRHHGQIEGMLNKVVKLEGNDNDKLQLFNRFKWELEKHFFTEEKAIFFFIDNEHKNINEMKSHLLKEHDVIMNNIEEIDTNLRDRKDFDVVKFRELLEKHKRYEDENFYPTLDNELDDTKKKIIMDRISNPV
jgi:hypothetical protein